MTAARLAVAAGVVATVVACGTPSDPAADTAPAGTARESTAAARSRAERGDTAPPGTTGSRGDTAGPAATARATEGTADRAPGPLPRASLADPAPGRGPILVLGDSLTVGAVLWGELEPSLEAKGWEPEIVGRLGESVAWALDEVDDRPTVPEVVVVGLGTNPGPRPDDFARDLDRLVSDLRRRGANLVVWIPPDDGDDPDRALRADAVRDATAPRMEVADWPVVLDRHPEYLGPDGIHLTEAGYRRLASFMVQAVGTWPTTRSA